MKNILLICSVLMFFQSGSSQNYRLLPTCADSTETNNPIVLKGDKGDQGFAGKAGPKGVQGSKGISGEDGRKGEKGDIADCSEYLRNLTERLTGINNIS